MSVAVRPTILIVDDESEITAILSDLFSGQFECATAGSAEEALGRLAEANFDLVVSDITMPGMSGLDMIPHIKNNSPDTVVVMISGMQTVESAIDALRLGAFDYVMKPFDLRQAEAVVSRALEHHELIVAKQRYENHLEELVEQRTAELDQALNSLEEAYRSTLKALTTALETRDQETHGHSERVVSYSLRLGREFGLDGERYKALEFGSLLHDIGKIGVPDMILRKPAKLTDEEWVVMREHPMHGQQILRGIKFLEGAARVVAQHHEKWDGSGYPVGLSGEDIDICARIFSVADAFDAITSDRVYRKGKPYQAAAQELDDWAGKQFDPKVVDAFHRVPEQDWAELHAQSLTKKDEEFEVRRVIEQLIEMQEAAVLT
ncbi:MAG TPA: HD domain-containing phosphohydrolase [Pyrinomonadaceae bacterium]|nr:HD domain-containing phosphohydrolase [Pyrinomonadaceae bacterium]